ncbi:MAG: response regulator transcription factor [Bdellovibrionales bacterium]|nr:response regulator transcription factor [Bdellovibrionales bacterium]
MAGEQTKTKLLFLDADEMSFQVWQCMASALEALPSFEFHHASDATEALRMMETIRPDVVVMHFDDDAHAEREAFFDSLFGDFPPVIVPLGCDEVAPACCTSSRSTNVITVEGCESLDGIHRTLVMAASAAYRTTTGLLPESLVH